MNVNQLYFDVGNTRIKWAWKIGAGLGGHGAALTSEVADTAPLQLQEQLENMDQLEVWICSVAEDEVAQRICTNWLGHIQSLRRHLVCADESFNGVRNNYDDLSALGVDRWVAALGARHIHQAGDLIIVDAGTAVTIDWLDKNHVFQGGVIFPGPKLMYHSLIGETAGIEAKFAEAERLIGKNTDECVNSGVSYALKGAVQFIVNEMKIKINQPTKVLFTGGFGEQLLEPSDASACYFSDLVLQGLFSIANRGKEMEGDLL